MTNEKVEAEGQAVETDALGLKARALAGELAHVGRDWGWIKAIDALKAMGFQSLREEARPERDWSAWSADRAGELPAVEDKERLFAFLWHEAGFLVSMDSFDEGRHRKAASRKPSSEGPSAQGESGFDRRFQKLNGLLIHYQIKLAARAKDKGGGARPSGETLFRANHSVHPCGDGTWIFSGSADSVNGGAGSVAEIIEACYLAGEPLPVDRWVDPMVHLDSGHYSQGPALCDLNRDAGLTAWMEPRLKADFDAFAASLPAGVRRAVLGRDAGFDEEVESQLAGSHKWNVHVERALRAAGLARASDAEGQIAQGWARALAAAERGRDFETLHFEPPHFEAELFGGTTILHAIATAKMGEDALPAAELDGKAREGRPFLGWLEKQPAGSVARWAATRDSLGETPAQAALAEQMADGYGTGLGMDRGLLGWLLNKGLGGEPGELASAALRELKELGGAQRACAVALAMFAELDQSGKPWAAPLRGEDGAVVEDEREAMAILAAATSGAGSAWLASKAEEGILRKAAKRGVEIKRRSL